MGASRTTAHTKQQWILILLKGSLTCPGLWLQASPNRMALSELPKAAQGQGQPHWESWEIRSACTHTEEEIRMPTHAKICRVQSCSSGIFHQEFPQKKRAAAFSRSNQRALESEDVGWLIEIHRHLLPHPISSSTEEATLYVPSAVAYAYLISSLHSSLYKFSC